MHVGQLESDNRIFMLEITRNEGGEWGQAARFQPPPTTPTPPPPRAQGPERNPVWNIRTRCTASIKVCSLLPSTPVCCLLLLSSLQTSASVLFFFHLFISPPISLPLSPFLLLLCQMPFSLLRDETESVGLIIPDRSFASTSLLVQLSSSRPARPGEITSRRGGRPLVLFKPTKGKISVWWVEHVGCNRDRQHTVKVTYIEGQLINVAFMPFIIALIVKVIGPLSSFFWEKHSFTHFWGVKGEGHIHTICKISIFGILLWICKCTDGIQWSH